MSEVPELITINDIAYYDANKLKEYDSIFFYGCARTVRKIIEKKNIKEDNYKYVTTNITY
jgi:hypothetical protein